MMKKGTLKITLKSDLCAGSGYSYQGLVDSDIFRDEYGIPYIPGRRIKGCLRESAESVLYNVIGNIEDIFGTKANDRVKGIVVGDAYIKNYKEIKNDLAKIKENKELRKIITPQKVLERFTHISSQTKLVDGVADDNSLRFTRVMNQYSFIDNKEYVFESVVYYEDSIEKEIEKIAKVTKNIGLKRNRGLGSVICTFEPGESIKIGEIKTSDTEGKERLDYVISNYEPLMLSSDSDNKTEKYISGQSVLGMLAGKYLSIEGNTAEDEIFKDMFLKGEVVYTNFYPCKNDTIYYPAPNFINKHKKSGKLINTLIDGLENEADEKYLSTNGNQPKKLTDKFVKWNDDSADILEVDTQIIYHHSKKGKSEDGSEGILYNLETVKANQTFGGSIYAPKKYVEIIENLLKSENVAFGKSRSAQYGHCEVTKNEKGFDVNSSSSYKKGDTLIVTLLSDTILLNKNDDYTVYGDEVYKILSDKLGIKYEDNSEENYNIKTKIIRGYNNKWNLRKPPVPAIAAGSFFEYKLTEDFSCDKKYIGERCFEGFGFVRLDVKETMKRKLKASNNDNTNDVKLSNDYTKKLVEEILLDYVDDKFIEKQITDSKLLDIKKAALGRVTLMLKESVSKNDNADSRFNDFAKRVESIKTEKTRNEITYKVLNKFGKKVFIDSNDKNNKTTKWILNDKVLLENEKVVGIIDTAEKLGINKDKFLGKTKIRWDRFAMAYFTWNKYLMKEED